jgi:hypothetical protein
MPKKQPTPRKLGQSTDVPPPTQASILTILAKMTRENEGSHTQSSSFSKTFSPRLLKKELSPMGEMGIGVQEKNIL